MTELERKLKAKIPGEDTGISVKHTICDVCCPTWHCGIDAYVKEGKLIKVEGTEGHPVNPTGILCPKGLSNRQYIYRKDRIQTPLRRVGERGSGEFEPISWEEAYQEIAQKLLATKQVYGAESVAFYAGFSKWFRPFLQRLAYSFGSPNYLSESSNCMTTTFQQWLVTTGNVMSSPDLNNAGVFLGWAYNPYYSRHIAGLAAERNKKRGMKIIIIDPRVTPAVERLADIHLQPRPGTDGALALGLAYVLIRDGMVDMDYIEKYVHGFAEYKAYVQDFTPENVEELTGVPAEKIVETAHLLHQWKPMAINESPAPINHHRNGFQTYRAIMSLSAIMGCYDRKGGQIPVQLTYNHNGAGYETKEEDYALGTYHTHVKNKVSVGAERFPLWHEFIHEAQANDLSRQIEQGTPYPIKAVFGFGLNYRISADSERLKKALLQTDFLVNTELFFTDTCKFCDIVLPVCTSMERSEFKAYGPGYLYYSKPVIDKLFQAKSDVDVITDLANLMDLDDGLLRQGMDAGLAYMLSDLPITLEQLKAADGPLQLTDLKPYIPGTLLDQGLKTKSGKFELYSESIVAYPHLDPLPKYRPSVEKSEAYPFHLVAGARLTNTMHSRLHDVPWLRSLRPEPLADISAVDGGKLGIAQGDTIEISSKIGAITLKANVTHSVQAGEVHLYHGYREADVNRLIDLENVDPYSGFAGYRSNAVMIRKV